MESKCYIINLLNVGGGVCFVDKFKKDFLLLLSFSVIDSFGSVESCAFTRQESHVTK